MMRIIDEEKSVNLSEKVTVEMSLMEMALITNAVGVTSKGERRRSLIGHKDDGNFTEKICGILLHAENYDDETHGLFTVMRDYMVTRGVFNDVP